MPLYALMQKASPPARRCRMVAANNIMNALFMVLGAAAAAGLAASGFDAPSTLRIAATANLIAAGWMLLVLRRSASTGEVIASKFQ